MKDYKNSAPQRCRRIVGKKDQANQIWNWGNKQAGKAITRAG